MKGQTNKGILGPKLQRRLRINMTDAEWRLWDCLRRRGVPGFRFRRQHPYGDYILDFVCLDAKIVIELAGGQHAERGSSDTARTRFLEAAGFRVLRFWNHEVLRDIEEVKQAIWNALHTPPPSRPSP